MERHPRSRAGLQPLWTPNYSVQGALSRSAMRPAPSPVLTVSPMSPRTLPSPMYTSTPAYNLVMRERDREMVNSLDPRGRQPSLTSMSPTEYVSPISEQASLAARLGGLSVASPTSSTSTPPQPTQDLRRQSVVAETRSMLLSGLSQSATSSLLSPQADRRQSASRLEMHRQRRHSLLFRQQLQVWGHVYFGNATSADMFVAATALRRPSAASSSSGKNADKPSPSPSPSADSPHLLTIRARVRPRDLERKPFVIQRTFDLEALRTTVPDPIPGAVRRPSAAAGPSARTPLPALRPRRRSSGTPSLSTGSPLTPDGGGRSLLGCANAVPIHMEYARSNLPVLAALILSGHVRRGDIIDLPLPHPEVWAQTVAYVYTGQGVLTEALKQNILHLGGKV